jgi:ABC-type Zn uptake system ZnuABC Zn-binding protein ZnuA
MKNRKWLWACVLAPIGLAVALTMPGCGRAVPDYDKDPNKDASLNVLASTPPLDCFVRNVAGRHARVLCLCTSTGPHQFEPGQRDIVNLRATDVFFLNGLELEVFKGKFTDAAHSMRAKIVDVGDKLPRTLLHGGEKHAEGHHHDHGEKGHADEDHHHHGEFDPHIWLGVPQAEEMVRVIARSLSSVDAAHADDYERQSKDYLKKLDELREHGKKALKDKKNKKIVAQHDSLGYFAETFGLTVVGSIQPQPGIEADRKRLANLAKVCRDEGVEVIAVEPQYSRAAAETLQRELKAMDVTVRIVEIDPMETADAKDLDEGYYVRVVKQNLDALAKHLQ